MIQEISLLIAYVLALFFRSGSIMDMGALCDPVNNPSYQPPKLSTNRRLRAYFQNFHCPSPTSSSLPPALPHSSLISHPPPDCQTLYPSAAACTLIAILLHYLYSVHFLALCLEAIHNYTIYTYVYTGTDAYIPRKFLIPVLLLSPLYYTCTSD